MYKYSALSLSSSLSKHSQQWYPIYSSSHEKKNYCLNFEKWMTYLRTSCLNFTISLSICQKYGFIAFFFCANKLDKPFRLPHSQPWPLSKLTENDISDASISTPRLSKNSIIFGYVTCPISKFLIKRKMAFGRYGMSSSHKHRTEDKAMLMLFMDWDEAGMP